MSFEEAAAIPDGALHRTGCLRRADLGTRGASSSTAPRARSEQQPSSCAKHFGAHVTAVCNTKNVELVRSLGADEVDRLHAARTSPRTVRPTTSSSTPSASTRSGGAALAASPAESTSTTDLGYLCHLPLATLLTRGSGQALEARHRPLPRRRTSCSSRSSIEAGKYRAVIDRTYPFEDVVEATRYVETGQKDGQLVLTVG